MMEKIECKNCKYFDGDCGKHHIDYHQHINYDIPSEFCYGECFVPSENYIKKCNEEKAQKLSKYSLEILERALEIAKAEVNNEATDCD